MVARFTQGLKSGLVCGLLLLLVAACGGVKFKRQTGGARYRALPVGTPVKVVDRATQLPQPTVFLGTLAASLEGDIAPDQSKAEVVFTKHAARYGCDAVVGPRVDTRTKVFKKKAQQLGADGKPVWVTTETIKFFHDWTAKCARTAAAPGGLAQGTGQTAALADDAPPGAPDDPGVVSFSLDQTPEPAEPRRPASPAAERVWKRLAVYRHGYLRTWGKALEGPAPRESEVLDCLNELMAQVTGPAGFWRRTVPHEWYGCKNDPTTAQCQQLDRASVDLTPYDRLQAAIGKLKPANAEDFLERSERRIHEYLDTYVPREPNLSGMQATPFYQRRLKPEGTGVP